MSKKTNSPKSSKRGRPKTAVGHERDRLAKLYDTTPAVIKSWQRQGAPVDDHEKMCAWLRNRKDNGSTFDSPTLEKAKLNKLNLEAKRLFFKIEADMGRYTPNDEVKADAIACAAAVRAEVMALRSEAPTWAGLSPAEIQDKATAFVNAMLSRLHAKA